MSEEYCVGYIFEKGSPELSQYIWDNGYWYEPITVDGVQKYIIREQIPLTDEKKAKNRINELKQKLSDTDYRAIKYAEGEISADDYAEMKAQRAEWRKEINELQTKYPNLV